MAKIIEDIVVVKFSKLAKETDTKTVSVITNDIRKQIEAAVQTVMGDAVIVEVEQK